MSLIAQPLLATSELDELAARICQEHDGVIADSWLDDDAKAAAEAKLDELARLSPMEYDGRRPDAARDLNVRRSTLDDEIKSCRVRLGDDLGAPLAPNLPPVPLDWRVDPWPEPVNGGELLDAVIARINRIVVISEDLAVTVTLFVLMDWCHEDVATFDSLPRYRRVDDDETKQLRQKSLRWASKHAETLSGTLASGPSGPPGPAVTATPPGDAARPAARAGRDRTTLSKHRRPGRPGHRHAWAIG